MCLRYRLFLCKSLRLHGRLHSSDPSYFSFTAKKNKKLNPDTKKTLISQGFFNDADRNRTVLDNYNKNIDFTAFSKKCLFYWVFYDYIFNFLIQQNHFFKNYATRNATRR